MLQRAPRLPSRVLVSVRAPGSGFDATIGNLSTSGARLLGVPEGMLRVGDRIEIAWQGRILPAEVRWHFDDTCGLSFAASLDESEIAALLASRQGP